MSVGSIEIKCMSDKPVNGLAKCRRIVTKVLIGDSYVNVYDSYRAMASSHEVKKYRQVYTGMSPDERQCITCDVDIPFRELWKRLSISVTCIGFHSPPILL